MPLVGWLAEDLAAYLAAHPHRADADAPLWPGARAGSYTHGARGAKVDGSAPSGAVDYDRRWELGTFYKRRYQPAFVAAGLPAGPGEVRFHDLRHTYESLYASTAVRSQQVAEWMRHANDTVTRLIYTRLFAEDTAAAVVALEAVAVRGRPSPMGGTTVRALPIARPATGTDPAPFVR